MRRMREAPPVSPAAAQNTEVRLHLRVLDQDHLLELSVPSGPRRLVELLPVARALSEQLTALALERARTAGKTTSCGPACGACCRQLVAISLVEAQGVAEVVASMPAERQAAIRQRFAEA